MKRACSVLFVICITSFPALAKSKRPIWIEKGFHPKYSEKLYFTGIGIAHSTGNKEKDMKRADDSAIAEIAKQIKVHVMEEIHDTMKHVSGEGTTTTEIEIKTRSQVNLVLEGVRIVDRYYDKKEKNYYSFAVLNRELAASSLFSDIKKLRREIETLMKKATAKLQRGRCWSALSDLARAAVLREEGRSKQAVLRVVAASPFLMEYQNPPQIPDWVSIKSAEEKVLEKIKIEKIKGNNQEGEAGMPLQEPLIVKVYCGEMPEGGVPLSAGFVAGKGRITERTKTSRKGLAFFRVHEVWSDDTEEGRIKISLDSDGLRKVDSYEVPEYFISTIQSGPSVFFLYRVPSKRTLSFVIYIEEKNINKPLDVPLLKPLVEDALTERNFRIVDATVSEADVYNLTPQEIVSVLKGIADVAIVGKISSQFSSRVMEGFYFARAEGVLKAIRIKDGKVLISKRAQAKGAGNTVSKAGMKALENVSKKLANEFAEGLDITF